VIRSTLGGDPNIPEFDLDCGFVGVTWRGIECVLFISGSLSGFVQTYTEKLISVVDGESPMCFFISIGFDGGVYNLSVGLEELTISVLYGDVYNISVGLEELTIPVLYGGVVMDLYDDFIGRKASSSSSISLSLLYSDINVLLDNDFGLKSIAESDIITLRRCAINTINTS
jgi:hypothetical protein